MNDEEWAEYKATGIIQFPEQLVVRVHGDKVRAESYRGELAQFIAQVKLENINNYKVLTRYLDLPDGGYIRVFKNDNLIFADIICPAVETSTPVAETVDLKPAPTGRFYWVPGCIGRYDFIDELSNGIPLKAGSVDGDTTNKGYGVSFVSRKAAGLPAPGVSPDGSIIRSYRVCQLEEADPDSGLSGSRLEMASAHIPMEGPFSISCVVRLRKEIQIDYSFSSKTSELASGYTVWNPYKARFLFSDDGDKWTATCPGSIAPLVGYKIPSRFSDHWAKISYP